MKKQRGFSLLELLVIFGIIVIISTIILVNLSQSKGKASDAAIVKNLNDLQTYSQLYYLDHRGDFSAFCGDAQAQTFLTNAGKEDGGSRVCSNSSDGSAWCAYAEMRANPNLAYCVDSGIKKGKFDKGQVALSCDDGGSVFACP